MERILLGILLVNIAMAECATQTNVDQMVDAISAFEDALETGEAAPYRKAQGALAEVADCLGERLNSPLVARYFRAKGLDSYATGRIDTATVWWAAARRLDPNAPLPLYPEGHEAADLYVSRDPSDVTWVQLVTPKRGPFILDGTETRDFPLDLPTVVQLRSGDGYDFEVVPPGKLPVYKRKRPVRIGLLAASGVSLVGSVTSLTIAASARKTYNQPGQDPVQLQAHRSRANITSAIGLGLAGISIGTGLGAALANR